MEKIIKKCLIIAFFAQLLRADQMALLNLTSQQATVTIDTALKSFTMQTNPGENLYLQKNLDNQVNQYDNPPAILNYDHSQIKKITINRAQSDMPQIIYYNGEVTSDNKGNPTGIYGTFIARSGNLQILQDGINVNGLTYNKQDLNSLKIKCLRLQSQLSAHTKTNDIQKEVNDLSQSLKLIELSDEVSTLGLQVALIRSELDKIINKLQIMSKVTEYHGKLQDIEKKLNPNNVDEIQEKISNMLTGLQTLDQTDAQAIIDPKGITEKISKLQAKITSIQNDLKASGHNILINADSPTI